MTKKQAYQKHKELHGEKACSYTGFTRRINKLGRSTEEAIKHPKGHNHGGPRYPTRYTIVQFQKDYYPDIEYNCLYARLRQNRKLRMEYCEACKSVEKH